MIIKAPYMAAGDILFWNSWTIHGSLDTQSVTDSRSSITMHAIPENKKFCNFIHVKLMYQLVTLVIHSFIDPKIKKSLKID